jgi:hypothetical protein
MSGEMVVGHISWSPEFKSRPDPSNLLTEDIQRLLGDGQLKFSLSAPTKPADPAPQEEAFQVALRPHQNEGEILLTLIGPGMPAPEVEFTYTNWKGETKQRRAVFTLLQWGSNEWHKEPQLLVYGYDLDKKAPRTYALRDISDIKPL